LLVDLRLRCLIVAYVRRVISIQLTQYSNWKKAVSRSELCGPSLCSGENDSNDFDSCDRGIFMRSELPPAVVSTLRAL